MINGENILIIGKRGTGKSVYVDSFIIKNHKIFDEIYIFDKVNEHLFLSEKYKKKIIFSDCINFVEEINSLYENCVKNYPLTKPILLVIDEFDTFRNPEQKKALYNILHYGRKYGIFLMGVVRRPVHLEVSILDLSDVQIVFRLSSNRDIKHLDLNDDLEQIKELKNFEYLSIDI